MDSRYLIEAMKLNEGFNHRKAEKDLRSAIEKLGGEIFDSVDPDSLLWQFPKISRKALITKLAAEMETNEYHVDTLTRGLYVYGKDDDDLRGQSLQVEIFQDDECTEKGFSFYIISVYYCY